MPKHGLSRQCDTFRQLLVRYILTDEIDSFIGVAQPWMCDEFGHVNRRFYAAMFDDATLVVLRFLDVDDRQDSLGWADVRTETDFRAEVSAGTILKIRSSVTKIGKSSLAIRHVMVNSSNGETAAVESCVSVRFDLQQRRSSELGKAVIARAESVFAA
ncbi:MAG: acyl-CoA thioesterase [Mesorhizobium sp.]|nr:MAG: acyl-CoA thioesterase [Mesorhizobium sp.]